jgi:hypothetical protein
MKKIIFLLAMFFTISAYSQSSVIESPKIPKQTGNAGKYLKTNGSKLAWANVTAGLTASLTPNYIPYAVSSSSLSNSEIFQTGAGYGSTVTVAGVAIKNRGIDMTGNNNFYPGEIKADALFSTYFVLTNSGYINSTGGTPLNISTNYNDVSICNGGGNVGIGTNAPAVKLHIDGNLYATGSRINGISVGSYAYWGGLGNEISSNYAGTVNHLILQYTAGGNVGIGTDSPTSKLHVVGLIEYADNTAATLAGLTIGAFYRTGDLLKVVH